MPAIFIGRFQPFHKGHLKAIKWILKKEKKIFIIIGSSQESLTKNNLFSFSERKEMIEKTLKSEKIRNFKIYGVPDFKDDIFWAKKILKITRLNPENTTVFTKNSWTGRCFRKIGVKVKPHPIFLNGLSATQIRNKISRGQKWQNFVPKLILDHLKEIDGIERIKFLSISPEKRIINFIKRKIKESGAKGGIVGVSGGLDSSVTAYLAKEALGKKAIFLWLPVAKNYLFRKNLRLLEKKLKTKIKEIDLQNIYKNFLTILPHGDKLSKGNLRPRIRMAILYYFANLKQLLVIGTANSSEIALGYFTKYGDGGADILPLGDLYKTEVIEMARRLKLPEEIIEATPTPELWPGQTTEKEIGFSYQKLDTILKLLSQGFEVKEISFLTNISGEKIKNILERKRKNAHKLSLPPICQLRF